MKRLIHRKWFRRSLQTLFIAISLLAVAIAAVDHHAAGAKRAALESLKSGGNLVEASKFQVEMPPDAENFAMIPLLVALREENKIWEENKSWKQPPKDCPVGRKFALLSEDTKGRLVSMTRSGALLDTRVFSVQMGLKGSAAEMLDQFDQRHAEVLESLREGLGRHWVVMPARADFSKKEAYSTTIIDLVRMQEASLGIALRAELAIAAGRSDIAFESLLINRRLSDLAMSESGFLAQLTAWNIDRFSMSPLFRGISVGAWDASSLAKLRQAWAGRAMKDLIARALNSEGVGLAIYCEYWKRDSRLPSAVLEESEGFLSRLRSGAAPDAWFDLNSAEILRTTKASLELVRSDRTLGSWWDSPIASENGEDWSGIHRKENGSSDEGLKGWVGKLCDLEPFAFDSLISTILKRGSRAMVDDSMANLACLLAEYKIAHGTYPAALETMGGGDIVDPLTGKPFVYRLEGDRFILYSIGPDGIDGGGDRGTGDRKSYRDQPDWVW